MATIIHILYLVSQLEPYFILILMIFNYTSLLVIARVTVIIRGTLGYMLSWLLHTRVAVTAYSQSPCLS